MKPKIDVAANIGLDEISDFLGRLSEWHYDGRLYRGHTVEGHRPTPKAFRTGLDASISTREHLAQWKKLIGRVSPVRPANDLEYLVLAQHYGVATALLDWTSNPLVALFFACNGDSKNDGEIWQLDPTNLPLSEPFDFDLFGRRTGLPILVDSETMNPRSKIQHSMMTLHSREESHPHMRQIFKVDEDTKIFTLRALRLFGIEPASIFDDPTQAARTFQEGLEIEFFENALD